MKFDTSYTLSELLNLILRAFKNDSIESFRVILFEHLTFNFCYLNEKINKYKYSHGNDHENKVLRYYDVNTLSTGIQDFYDDIMFEINDIINSKLDNNKIVVEIVQTNNLNIIIYESDKNCLNYKLSNN